MICCLGAKVCILVEEEDKERGHFEYFVAYILNMSPQAKDSEDELTDLNRHVGKNENKKEVVVHKLGKKWWLSAHVLSGGKEEHEWDRVVLKEQTGWRDCLTVGGTMEGNENDLQAFSWEETRELFLR